jgi:3-phenylpropionate/trans-cinnamate dioxygenase ferredoxin reductase subunit
MAEGETIRDIVVVGTGIAGASAVEMLRREGYDGRITLVGDEPETPYDRPPLSKGYILGTTPEAKLTLRPASYYIEHTIELRLGQRATHLDLAARRVTLADGERLRFDRLLIATGGAARRLSIPGADLDGIRYLRTLADARALLAELSAAASAHERAVVVGAGFIGAEVASACRELGLEVTLMELLPLPLGRVLGAEMGRFYAETHRMHGVDLRLGESVAAFRGAGRVEEVVTTGGARIPCGFVLVGVGMRPADDWLRDSGLPLDGGISVDAYCETSALGVFAAGDVARWPYASVVGEPAELLRLEHWDNGLRQGEAAARNLLGQHIPFAPVPYFWSDQYDLKLQYVGYAHPSDTLLLRGHPRDGAFIAFYLRSGRVRAAAAINRIRDLAALKKLIGTAADPARLSDESVDLRALAAQLPRP